MGLYDVSRAHSEFWKGVRAGILHGNTITTERKKLPPVVDPNPFYHGFRAGILCAWRHHGMNPVKKMFYRGVRPDRYVAVAWRRYERGYGR